MAKICCFFNYPPHYRFPIYKAMSETFDCDFFFGDTVFEPIRKFDVNNLNGFKQNFKAVKTKFKGYVWYKGCLQLFRFKYDYYILTGENCIIPNWLILLWAKITNRKVLLWTHGVHETISKKTTRFVLSMFYTHADYLLMYNNYNWRYMEQVGCNCKQMRTIHNSLDTSLQTQIYSTLKPTNVFKNYFGNDNPVVIYIGRIQKRKKLEQVIEALALGQKQKFEFNVVIVGSTLDNDSVMHLVERYGLCDKVWFYGPCFDEKNNAQLLYDSSVCVCPAEVGLTAIHALSYGCPVISNDNFEKQMPEFESIIEGKIGSFYRENDISDLLTKIMYWCKLSDTRRMQIRKDTRKLILSEWSVDYQIKVLKELLK